MGATPYCAPPGRGPVASLRDLVRAGGVPAWPQLAGHGTVLTYRCRTAIDLVLEAWGIAAGDDVLVPAYNCGSEVDVLVNRGITPVLCPVDERARLVPDELARQITDRTRACLVIHYFGWPQPLGFVRELCADRSIRLLEDWRRTLFSRGPDGWLGTAGDAAVFSFAKTLAVPDGGAAVLRHGTMEPALGAPGKRDLALRLARLARRGVVRRLARTSLGGPAVRWLGGGRGGEAPPDTGMPDVPASYYFDDASRGKSASRAARGVLAVTDPETVIAARRANWISMHEGLEGVPGITPFFTTLPDGVCPLVYPFLVEKRSYWIETLSRRGAYPIPWWAGYHAKLDWSDQPATRRLKDSMVALPVHQELGPRDVGFMIEAVRDVGGSERR